jgi:hypothetical protein
MKYQYQYEKRDESIRIKDHKNFGFIGL